MIVEEGNHQQLLERGGIYANLVKRQIQRMQNTISEGSEKDKKGDVVDSLIDQVTELEGKKE